MSADALSAESFDTVTEVGCQSCGSPSFKEFQSREGTVRMCPACAVMNGIGCP
ncbi:MAG: hypothetical protein LW606_08610 [Ilumatobacteraceae bacterium]|nr:hypothetical protein [Ilumatobacteraceae bacterium]